MSHRPFRRCERSEATQPRRDARAVAVMAGLVPAIHAVVQTAAFDWSFAALAQGLVERLQPWRRVTAWMAGTSPAMTAVSCASAGLLRFARNDGAA